MLNARSLVGKPIGLRENFITDAECKQLLFYAKSASAGWETYLPPSDVWYERMINPRSMPPKVLKLMGKIRKRAARAIIEDYGITEPVFADTLQLIRWRPGDDQAPHADCEEPDGRPNQTPWRAFASIIYLNDDFEGGQIHFPGRFLEPKIKAGMLAYFPSTREYLHGVKEITAGMRYTHSCFYTFDPRRHDGHPV
ncbi:MAG: 2OG-Fe(II) oxygenase [Novosphingobium sp.]